MAALGDVAWRTSPAAVRWSTSSPPCRERSSSPGKLILGTRNDTALWTGTVGPDKAVAWSAPLPLADVKAVARVHKVTVNDVLVTCGKGRCTPISSATAAGAHPPTS